MCGFSGILKIKDRKDIDLKKTVAAMCDRLVHRGPDDKGLWIDEQKKHYKKQDNIMKYKHTLSKI